MTKKSEEQMQAELLQTLEEICDQLGWNVAVPSFGPDEPTEGLILGSKKFLEKVLTPFGVDVELMLDEETGEGFVESEEVTTSIARKKETLH